MNDDEDFPLSPVCWADSHAYFQAFLEAKQHLASVPAKSRSARRERELHELTSHFYGARSAGKALYRSRGELTSIAAVWLSRVRTISSWFQAEHGIPDFRPVDDELMTQLRLLAANSSLVREVAPLLFDYGILLVYERAIPGLKADGAVFTLPSGNPVIAMSLRFSRLDNYWFTLMHEIGHIQLHSSQLDEPIVDDLETESDNIIEKEADRYASDALIPRNIWRNVAARYTLRREDVLAFSKSQGIAPEVVAGRLRRDLRRHDLFSDLVHSSNVREILFGQD